MSGLIVLFTVYQSPSNAGSLNLVNLENNVTLFSVNFNNSFSGLIPAPNNLLDVKFSNDMTSADLTVLPLYTFEDTNADNSQRLNLVIEDDWAVTVKFDFVDLVGDAKLNVAANLQHVTFGHPGDKNTCVPYNPSFPEISAESFRKAGKPEEDTLKMGKIVDHRRQDVQEQPHKDAYNLELEYDLDYSRDHFDNWSFKLEARHTIPEPSATLGLLAIGIGGLASILTKRLKSFKFPEKVS